MKTNNIPIQEPKYSVTIISNKKGEIEEIKMDWKEFLTLPKITQVHSLKNLIEDIEKDPAERKAEFKELQNRGKRIPRLQTNENRIP